MKKLEFCILTAAALGLSSAAFAGDKVDCASLKQKIETKMTANGVKNIRLDVVDKAQSADGKVVGTCDGGAHKIVYAKESAPVDAKK